MALSPAASPWAATLPYEAVPSDEAPSKSWLTPGSQKERALLPNQRDSALVRIAYQEAILAGRDDYGMVTLRTSRLVYVSVLHYSAQDCYIVRHALPVPTSHETTLTFALPPSGGLTRVLLWRAPPDDAWLQDLAGQPNQVGQPLASLLAQRWFERQPARPLAFRPPWEDPLVSASGMAGGPMASYDRLLCSVELSSDLTVHAKDCAMLFQGIEQVRLAPFGSVGVWPLGWGDSLSCVFELPDELPARASLQIDGWGGSSFPGDVELQVNGWVVQPDPFGPPSADPLQHDGYSVGQYLKAGQNRIQFRGTGITGAELTRLELWED